MLCLIDVYTICGAWRCGGYTLRIRGGREVLPTFYRIFHALLDSRLYYLWRLEVWRVHPSHQRGSRGLAYFIFSWVISMEMGLLGGNMGDLKQITLVVPGLYYCRGRRIP